MKIGMYTEDEIFNYMTNCEGSMLGRSMYDAIFDKIYALITENEQQEKDIVKYKSLYENEKEHTDTLKRIIKEVKKYLEGAYEMATYTNSVCLDEENIEDILDLLKEIK